MAYLVSHPDEVKAISWRWGKGAENIDRYLELDGYKAVRKAIEMGPEGIINEMKASNLRGRGGAGFPTGMKWSFVPKESAKPKYILCNGDESEPGTCKDRLIFEHDPHSVIEGVMIAGLAVGAKKGYIYLRGEYRYLSVIMQKAIADAYAKGFLGKNIFGSGIDFDVYWHGGAGAYEVGEESALMESLEGKRGVPRIRPPFPAVVGLWGGPTVINNAETLASVPHILLMGGQKYAEIGTPKNGGTRLFCLSGNVEKPGVYELPMGYNLKKMIYDVAGGIWKGRNLKAVVPGGSSVPVLLANEIDVAADFDSMMKAGTMLGSGGVIIIDDHTCMVKFALRTIKFYQHESCGWCIPCREGTDWLKKTLIRFHAGGGIKKDIDNLYYLAENMLGRTFCPLGDAAAMPIMGFVKKFREEFEAHLEGRPCPYEDHGSDGQIPVLAQLPVLTR
ncbi:MAG TPA: NADH-quinone oxidoreductase subunit NuoF [Terriglobales bacterium]|nr:NADH-quinone oxidoreductase subunit NuoF [Terriglobales bacterium]